MVEKKSEVNEVVGVVVPGVPAGWELVKLDTPVSGDLCLDSDGSIYKCGGKRDDDAVRIVPIIRRAVLVSAPVSVPKPQWSWGKPDRPGLWLFSGSSHKPNEAFTRTYTRLSEKDFYPDGRELHSVCPYANGWWVRLSDYVEILPPKPKVRIEQRTERMWFGRPDPAVNPVGTGLFEQMWIQDGHMEEYVKASKLIGPYEMVPTEQTRVVEVEVEVPVD